MVEINKIKTNCLRNFRKSENNCKMCNFQYCSGCLVTGVKMQSFHSRIESVPIGEAFFRVLNISVNISGNNICFECASLLFKYYEFRSKCLRAQSILSSIGKEDTKEIYKQIQNIDRKQNKLESNLSESHIKLYDNQTSIVIEVIKLENQIKTEIIDNKDQNELHLKNELHDYGAPLEDIPISTQISKQKRKRKTQGTKLKKKSKKYNNVKLKISSESESDNEPLAKKMTNNIDIKENGTISKEINKTQIINKNSKIEKKLKDFDDFENYATVVYLTLEDAKKEVLLRKESSNYINSPLKCDLCYRGYEAKVAFENHMKKHSVEYGEYQCDICHLRFPAQRYLCKHRLASHKRKFCCKICTYVCFCMHQAKTHVNLHKGKKYPCKECAEVFSMPNSLLMHKRQKHSTECVCELCGHTFATARGLYSHHMKLHRHHKNDKLGPKCAECNKHFATEMAWKLHLVLSSKHDVSNGCKFCGETFSSFQELKEHLRVHTRKHAAREFKPATCSMCDKWLGDRTEYNLHMSSVHPQCEAARKLDSEALTPFVCEVCGKMFKKQCFLTYHQRKHSGERPYKCIECDKTFHLAAALSTHRAVHRAARAHACGICARVFTFKSVLNKHMKVHLGIRPHRCDICDKSFISPCDVKVHIKYVHNKVPWPKRKQTHR